MRRIVATAAVFGLTCCLLLTATVGLAAERPEQRALDAMREGDYRKASRLLEKLLEEQPDDPRALYNLACCLSRLGELKTAAERLEQAWQAGLRDPDLLRGDPDLQALRETRSGATLIDRLVAEGERARRLRGELHYFEAEVLGGLRVVPPARIERDRKYPLVVILHGHGANPENYAGMFEQVDTPLEAFVVAPYGPYPIFHGQGRGYSWYPEPAFYQELLAREGAGKDRERLREEIEDREQAVTEAYVLSAIEALRARYPVDESRIYVMGHSEGGVLAYGLGLRNSGVIRGLIVVGARLRERDALPETLSAAAGRLQVLICHSREDNAAKFEDAEKARETLKQAGVESKLVAYAGGHGITAELLRTIARWIDHVDRRENTQD